MRATVTDIRARRVSELKRRVADGSYEVDVDAVATALVEVIRRARSREAGRAHPAS
jgi:anti-sigma28 factor (negative regulator of flagellin synthesis)